MSPLLLNALLATTLTAGPQIIAPQRLRVEYEVAPLGLDVKIPRFSWALGASGAPRGLVQAAYAIEVVALDTNTTLWTSGMVLSNRSTNVRYAPKARLPANGAFAWRVQWWFDSQAPASAWSSYSTFTTGLYTAADWKGAEWITMQLPAPATDSPDHVLLRSPKFALPTGKTVARASAFIVGIGYYHLYIDGTKVSTHSLGAFTTFEKRVMYDTWDATALFAASGAGSEHVIALEVGPGFYNQKSVEDFHAKGRVKLARVYLSLKFTDGTAMDVVTTTKWLAAEGPITHSDIYDGEYVDLRKDDRAWNHVVHDATALSLVLKWQGATAAAPPTPTTLVTSHAVLPKIGVRESYSPIAMYESAPGEYVYDFGQNMAGVVTFSLPAGVGGPQSAGRTVSLRHAEAVHGPPPAKIFNQLYDHTKEIVNITLAGDGLAVEYTPKFTYMGFRYVQLTGYPGVPTRETLTAHFLNTMYDLIGEISFSDPNLNAVQQITRMAAMSNFQSIPTDCPQRERRGWLGDAQLSSRTNTFNFGMAGAYTHFVGQIQDAQDPATGATQDCVPWYGHGFQPSDPSWGAAYTYLAELIFEQYDDDDVVGLHYAGIKAHIDSLTKQAGIDNEGGLLHFSCWGDWCPPSGCGWNLTHDAQGHSICGDDNSALVSSFQYISQLRMIARFASILGHADDAAKYTALDKAVSAEFVKRYYVPENKTFFEPNRVPHVEELTVQTCISLASSLGLVPEEDSVAVFETLVEDVMVKHGGHLDVGIVGVKELLPALVAGGRSDVALHVAQTPDEPGWVYMVLQGATTLWETWTGTRYAPAQAGTVTASWNHIMFGSQSAWYFESLAGIQLAPGARGWQRLVFKPAVWAGAASPPASLCGNLSFVDASIDTIRGAVAAAWQCPINATTPLLQFTYTVTVPSGSTASVVLPTFGVKSSDTGLTVKEGGVAVWAKGAFVGSSVDGVVSAAAGLDLSGPNVAVEIGSGTYTFTVFAP